MYSTVKMSKKAKICLSLVKIEVLIEKSCEKNSSQKIFFRLIRPIFYFLCSFQISNFYRSWNYILVKKTALKYSQFPRCNHHWYGSTSVMVRPQSQVKRTLTFLQVSNRKKKWGRPDINCYRN